MIDTQTPESPGWWISRLATQLNRRQMRYRLLDSYATGNPPLPVGAEAWRDIYQAFQRKARSNFADLIVQAMLDRVQLRTVRTAAARDDDGDALAMRYYQRNQLDVGLKDLFEWKFTFGRAYMSVGQIEPTIGVPLIAAEDPRQTITARDPVTRQTKAALKLFHDDAADFDYAYLWLPGELHVAARPRRSQTLGRVAAFTAGSYDWDEKLSATWDKPVVPVVEFLNRRGVGEFEAHLDILDRINHMLLQRMVIATMQAFRQRALKVDAADMPQTDPVTGEDIDYDDIFAADPGALWRLPKNADLWESSVTDLTPMLASVKDDVLHLAAVTRTPLTMFTPDAATHTAEGAQLQREGLVFKVEDRETRATSPLAQVFSLAFTFDPDNRNTDVAGQSVDRADLDQIEIDWTPPERFSLAERAAASVQAAQAQVPWRTRGSHIWGFTPAELDRQEAERMEDALFAVASGQQNVATPQLPPDSATADRLARQTDNAR